MTFACVYVKVRVQMGAGQGNNYNLEMGNPPAWLPVSVLSETDSI